MFFICTDCDPHRRTVLIVTSVDQIKAACYYFGTFYTMSMFSPKQTSVLHVIRDVVIPGAKQPKRKHEDKEQRSWRGGLRTMQEP